MNQNFWTLPCKPETDTVQNPKMDQNPKNGLKSKNGSKSNNGFMDFTLQTRD